MIYTIVPHDQVFSEKGETTNYKQLEIGGISLLVEPISHTTCKIVKLLSTNPAHYLDTQYQPGTIIDILSLYSQ